MSVLLALCAFPLLTFLLMALARAEESLVQDMQRQPVNPR